MKQNNLKNLEKIERQNKLEQHTYENYDADDESETSHDINWVLKKGTLENCEKRFCRRIKKRTSKQILKNVSSTKSNKVYFPYEKVKSKDIQIFYSSSSFDYDTTSNIDSSISSETEWEQVVKSHDILSLKVNRQQNGGGVTNNLLNEASGFEKMKNNDKLFENINFEQTIKCGETKPKTMTCKCAVGKWLIMGSSGKNLFFKNGMGDYWKKEVDPGGVTKQNQLITPIEIEKHCWKISPRCCESCLRCIEQLVKNVKGEIFPNAIVLFEVEWSEGSYGVKITYKNKLGILENQKHLGLVTPGGEVLTTPPEDIDKSLLKFCVPKFYLHLGIDFSIPSCNAFMANSGDDGDQPRLNDPCYEAYIDSGASRGITYDINDALPGTMREEIVQICLAGKGKNMYSKYSCSVCVMDDRSQPFIINDVLIVEDARSKLISTSGLDGEGFYVNHGGGRCVIKKNKTNFFDIPVSEGMYTMKTVLVKDPITARGGELTMQKNIFIRDNADVARIGLARSYTGDLTTYELRHRRLAHVNNKELKKAYPNMSIPDAKTCPCTACIQGKLHAFPFKSRTRPAQHSPGEKVHFDLGGPFVPTIFGEKYRAIFVDDQTSMWKAYFMRKKSDFEKNKEKYVAWMKKQAKIDVTVMHSDRGGEFTSNAQKEKAENEGVEQILSSPYAPAQNGKAERHNRTLDEAVTTAMMLCNAPANFWGECTRWVVFTHNNIPNIKSENGSYKSRKQMLLPHDRGFNVDFLRNFGSESWLYIRKSERSGRKSHIRLKAIPCIFLGYEDNMSSYRLWDLIAKKIRIAAWEYVVTNENSFPWKNKENWSATQRRLPNSYAIPKINEMNDELYELYDIDEIEAQSSEEEESEMSNDEIDGEIENSNITYLVGNENEEILYPSYSVGRPHSRNIRNRDVILEEEGCDEDEVQRNLTGQLNEAEDYQSSPDINEQFFDRMG